MDLDAQFEHFEVLLEDFWGRRESGPAFARTFAIFGRPVRLTSNVAGVLSAVDFAQPLYSTAPITDDKPYRIHIVARRAPVDPGPLPDNLFDHIQYTGHNNWLAMQLGPWGHCQIKLARSRALAVLVPELAEQPAMVSRYLLNTILTNFLIASGYGFLHATALLRGRHLLLLMAPHDSGKSTTALRLALAGYALVSDSIVFVGAGGQPLYGFPVGRVKLRNDMVADFPELQPLLEAEPIRGELKYAVDLRDYDRRLVHEAAVWPEAVYLCLLARHLRPETQITTATREEVYKAVIANSLFYDTAEVWYRNLARIGPLVEQERCYHLLAGTDERSLYAAVNALWA